MVNRNAKSLSGNTKPPIGVRVKFFLLRHYWWALGMVLAGAVSLGLTKNLTFDSLLPILAATLSALYFLQKQKLEELKTFREIFEACNERYREMNEKLDQIMAITKGSLDENEQKTLNEYFNLCAEEYLYFSRGYIFPEVWRAWYNGMKYYLENPRIRKFWDTESSTDSHYGLQF